MKDHLKNAERIANLMDNKFSILGFKFGLDPLIGLIPGLGDTLTLIVSFYLIWIGTRMNIPNNELKKMIFNLAIDFTLGYLPVIGDLTDFVFKANERNFRILRKYGKE